LLIFERFLDNLVVSFFSHLDGFALQPRQRKARAVCCERGWRIPPFSFQWSSTKASLSGNRECGKTCILDLLP
jgi:hypothetical protein